MFFTVYILESGAKGNYYIGQTNDLERRLAEHNSPRAKSTRRYQPWIPIYAQSFATRAEAVRREKYLKSVKNKIYLKKLIVQR